jgi:hypothetical protein
MIQHGGPAGHLPQQSQDRRATGGELRRASTGERKHDVELPNDEIAYFQEQRRPDRFFPGTTTLKPLHPIIIEDVPSMVQAGGHYE